MKVKFIDNLSYQIYPIADDMIDIDEETLNEIGKSKQYINGKFIPYNSNHNTIAEISSLKNWFNNYYAEHEQKYRRLHTLGLKTDNGEDAYTALINLYNEAEIKRKRIQELEHLINDSTNK